jgi:hypothetical protein
MPFLNFDAIKAKILDNSTIVVGKISDVFPPYHWGFHYDYCGESSPLQKLAAQDLQDRMVSNIGTGPSTLTCTLSNAAKNVNADQVKNFKNTVVKNLNSDTGKALAGAAGIAGPAAWVYDKYSTATTEAKVEAEVKAQIVPAKQEIRDLKVENQSKTEVAVALKKALDTSEATNAILNQQLADSLARERELKAQLKIK